MLPANAIAAGTPTARASRRASSHALLSSHELWATIDVCNPPEQLNGIGIRGSMPGDREAHDRMYMSFRLQYLNAMSKRWTNLQGGASAGYVAVGAGSSARQGGLLFTLKPLPAGSPAAELRGIVDFQWREGRHVLLSSARPTAAGHMSLAGADPPGFSAATCLIS
jgi:hypothetical protein